MDRSAAEIFRPADRRFAGGRALLLLLLALGAAVRLLPLRHEALSGDEIFSRQVVLQPVLAGYAAVRDDLVHPPLYYAILKAGTSVWGAGALGLRAISLACGVASIGLMVLLGLRLPGSRWSPWLASAAMTVGRYFIFYSQEARSYALYTALVLLLVLWVDRIAAEQRSSRLWAAGAGLMTALLYTHYVGAIYMGAAILTLLVSQVETRTKLLAVGAGLVATLLFLPWLGAVAGVYRAKHGLVENLGWQGQPGLSDLKQLWASSLGVMTFHGATTLALLLVALFAASAFVPLDSEHPGRRSPALLALVLLGTLPPLVVFLASRAPFNLPVFALRHLLPSTALLLLLSAYGMERLVQRLPRHQAIAAAAGGACILSFAAIPTIQALRAGPMRYPYDRVERQVETAARMGFPAYAVWPYGEGAPINFYCRRACVQPLPAGLALPPRLLLIYRPGVRNESRQYDALLDRGYVDLDHRYYTDGSGTVWGTMAATLQLK